MNKIKYGHISTFDAMPLVIKKINAIIDRLNELTGEGEAVPDGKCAWCYGTWGSGKCPVCFRIYTDGEYDD